MDDEFSKLIRSVGRCDCCRGISNLQTAHIVGRSNHALRWNPLNAICLCKRCHIFKFHRDPLGFVEWLETTYPERMVYLREHRNKIIKRTTEDYEELLGAVKTRDISRLVKIGY